MKNIWFVKNDQKIEEVGEIVFNLRSKNNKSNVKTDVENLWRLFSEKTLAEIVEDFLIVAIAVFSVDKKISRKSSSDSWGRELNLHIPVLKIEEWVAVTEDLEESLSFLTGDIWNISFYRTNERFRGDKINKKFNIKNPEAFDCVSLFSGGLDSFCGALTLLDEGNNPLFLGFKEYSLLPKRQNLLISSLRNQYTQQNIDFIQFNVSPGRPTFNGEQVLLGENTSRSRSLLFIAGAIAVASMVGNKIPVYIPENGFIGLNVPLTQSRLGSCSTRTTHPYFIRLINEILQKLGIEHKLDNFYSTKSKGEIIHEHRNNAVFQEMHNKTLSCSHPAQSRYDAISPPINCGYCYPCLIRKASLVVNGFVEDHYNPKYTIDKEFIERNNKVDGKASDLKAVLFSIRRFIDNEQNSLFISGLLRRHGKLAQTEIDSYEQVYRKSINELLFLMKYEDDKNNSKLLEYMGLKEYYEQLH
ncbi:Qat anti-phage system QueC-like protein QatC [Robertmurraya massiliosenegalensis]|uniref:Qat anti-phage system QueC-like protein QatC n=1 Tax=Robertmurraya TaxID=2837507 RepID=UPI0039A66D24